MTCKELTEFLLDYLAGDLPHDVRITFDEHLAACRDCRNYLDSYRKTIAMTRQTIILEFEDVPEALLAAIMSTRKVQPAD